MGDITGTGDEPEWIREGLSSPRFAPYLVKSGGDMAAAIDLYWWNVSASAAFYTPLHCLEMVLRNALHRQLTIKYERIDWWESVSLNEIGKRMLDDARRKVAKRGRVGTADDMVTEFPFGFWVSLLSKKYDREIWVPCLHKAFPFYRGERNNLHKKLQTTLLFRNRIMHHEPIHHRHLEADHQTILRLLDYVSPGMVEQLRVYDSVEAVLRRRPGCT